MKTELMKTAQMEASNNRILEALKQSPNGGIDKSAEAAFDDYTRTQLREGSFAFKILPPTQITPDQLDRQLTAQNIVIRDLEPDAPGAKWVALQDIPEGHYITDSRYIIPFASIVTPKFEKDIRELYTVRTDIRKILTDNSIKDGLSAIDDKFIGLTRDICMDYDVVGGKAVQRFTGKVQYRKYANFTRESLADALTMLPSGSTTMPGKFRLRNHVMLMNDVTAQQVLKWDRTTIGGDIAQEHFQKGLVQTELFGLKSIVTIKDDIIADGEIFFFAAPEFLGQALYLDDWTTWMKKEAFFIQMFSYWYGGISIGNVAGVALAEFVPASFEGGPMTAPAAP